jgi:hypothetical protein
MSPKTSALVRLYVVIAVLAAPGLAALWTTDGYPRIGAGISLFGLSLACVYHAYQTAIGQLPGAGAPPEP